MSKQVHCPECQSENTPGSKFCNSCGARLPKSTSILCPRCQTPNPHNNFYCDSCGGRLHAEQNNIPSEEEPKQEASDLPTSAKMFTLPTRDPGDTGDLDPASLPNWLENQSAESQEGEGADKLPRLSDLTPEERKAAEDLPGWLINTENEELLIDSPDDITTEHFLHLIQDINEEEREKLSGLLSDPSIAGETANLPDWLKDVAQPTSKDTFTPSTEEDPQVERVGDSDDDEADWLFALDATDNEAAQSTAEATLAQEETNPQDPDGIPDWLGELGPPRTAMLGNAEENEQPSAELVPDVNEDLPDWLTGEDDSPETSDKPQASEEIFADAYSFEDDVPDWMLDDEQPENTSQQETPAQDEALDDLTLDDAAATSLTGWLAEFDTDDDVVEETAVSPQEAPPANEGETQRSLTDWLTAFDEEDLVPDVESSEPIQPEKASEDSLPDWLTGIDEAVSAAAAIVDKPSAEVSPVEEDSFDWLSDFNDTTEDSSITNDATTEPTDDSLDLLSAEEISSEPEDTLADVLNLDISTDNSLVTGDTGPLPDWLDDLEPVAKTSSSFDSSELDNTLEDLFGAESKNETSELEWLEEIEDNEIESEPDSVDSSLAPLVGAIGAAALLDASLQDDDTTSDDAATLDGDPDWLSELTAFDSDDVVESMETAVTEPPTQPTIEDDFDIEAIFEATESADLDGFDIDDELLGVDAQTTGDWSDIDGILAGTADEEALPDWLEQLDDAPETEIIPIDSDEEPPEEIPAWVANMRPDETGELASVLPSALFTDSDASELLSDTGDLADADLPDWLDATVDERVATAEREPTGWFDSDGTVEDAPAELEALLADLPPAQAPEDMLQKAEIPEWLEELKPRELTGEAPPITESKLESSGPLAGMPNTIAIEPIIAMPRAASLPGSYAISPEQVQQVLLLRQLVQEEPKPPQPDTATISVNSIAGLRILVAILLLAAIIIGLYGPAFLKSKTLANVPIPAAAINSVISDNAGKTVLVAFEYTPALAGELNHEAETLLTQLNAVGSPILTTSQYVAGTAVAEAMTIPYDVTALGFIPGEAMGLRQLGNCLGKDAPVSPCTTLHNRSLNSDTADILADVGLIIVLTGERSSLVNWVEQVGTSSNVPIVIGATQALAPVVVPYYASTQVDGYLNGLPATVAYQQEYIQVQITDTPAKTLYGGLSLVYLVTAVILLIGGLALGFRKKKA